MKKPVPIINEDISFDINNTSPTRQIIKPIYIKFGTKWSRGLFLPWM